MTTDASGNVYVVDTYNYRIQKFTSTGTFLAKWGTSGSADGSLLSSAGNHRLLRQCLCCRF
ncbi:MAG: hypothetical protein H6793_02305 [Candidatus Nomurabacteria bacterium]|nr:MAG: hypothetical protein H6793_02305 [Candidatus Nomurabacteria bacterium]